jgi:hypothetical protein
MDPKGTPTVRQRDGPCTLSVLQSWE